VRVVGGFALALGWSAHPAAAQDKGDLVDGGANTFEQGDSSKGDAVDIEGGDHEMDPDAGGKGDVAPCGDADTFDQVKDWTTDDEHEYDQLLDQVGEEPYEPIWQTSKGTTSVMAPTGGGTRGEVFTKKNGMVWTEDWVLRDVVSTLSGSVLELQFGASEYGDSVEEALDDYGGLTGYSRLHLEFSYAKFPPTDPTVITNLPPVQPPSIDETYQYRVFTVYWNGSDWVDVEESGALYRELTLSGMWRDVWVLWDNYEKPDYGVKTRIEPVPLQFSTARAFLLDQQAHHAGLYVKTVAQPEAL
jgi:hypothetical protein